MRSSPRTETAYKIKSPTTYFNKHLFSPRTKDKAKSSTALNVRRFSTDSVFNSQTLKYEQSSAIGRRLSKDASVFLSSSPPDINSRRSSYLDIISSGSKLAGKSPILSIENLSDSSKYSEPLRKLSDSESIGKKLATLPRYQESFEKHRLQPQYSLTFGQSAETLGRSEKDDVTIAKSFDTLPTPSSETNKCNLSDDEIARRNKKIINELQGVLQKNPTKPPPKQAVDNNNFQNTNPQIRIQVEDTSTPKIEVRHPPLSRTKKTRHQSLGDSISPNTTESRSRKSRLPEQSRSLDSGNPTNRERSKSKSRLRDSDLPPAPPPPNCSPRNLNGRSPLERLSKEELVLLWRSSESELRSHLLKALRDKDEPSDPP